MNQPLAWLHSALGLFRVESGLAVPIRYGQLDLQLQKLFALPRSSIGFVASTLTDDPDRK